MPRYEFRCPSCGFSTDRWVPMREIKDYFDTCDMCGSTLHRKYGVGVMKVGGKPIGNDSRMFDASIRGLHEQSLDRKREGDGIRNELGMGHFNMPS